MSLPVRLSVVIATYRRPALLARCLAAVSRQAGCPPYEVVVADDGCQQEVERLVSALAAAPGGAGPVAWQYLAVPRTRGPAAARNAGWRMARGEVIAFTDDDTIADAAWLAQGWKTLEAVPDAAAAAGKVLVPLSRRPTDHERNTGGLMDAEFVTANCFVRRAALERLGGFDERFQRAWREDSDLHYRLLEHTLPVVAAGAALVVHPVRPARWGSSIAEQSKVYFDALLYKKHPLLYRRRIRARPPWHYYASTASVLLTVVAALAGRPALAGAAAAAWAALTAAFCARRLRGTSHAPGHVVEMAATSALIPLCSVYWRLRGGLAFRTVFL
ncbi:glycosyltransferase family 2 protein [Cupriavidus malaysiensis]|uniref:Glycosyl transferase family 2 n=1 Tax=Cupriavidus malaysiensis TaxID=367825 RepID=A0ABM6FFM5_9BURK|nr:glycosyltransferase family A protein [Cupriavidus malaysiensis]AOZ10599.1 glycosyl transferase family 2 [Cupriavidus malaysiensis]